MAIGRSQLRGVIALAVSAAAVAAWPLGHPPARAVSTDPVIAAAGDIACDPSNRKFRALRGTADACRARYTSDLLVHRDYRAVLALGDLQYRDGRLWKFNRSYGPTWGRVRSITRPAAGNHEYQSGDASGYFDYFNGPGNFSGRAGSRAQGYYSFDIGQWHLIALNSNCGHAGGCGLGSPQELWLRQDLLTHSRPCTLAFWHHPMYSSGRQGDAGEMRQFWSDLVDARADVVLSGHDHDYERFGPQDADGNHDPNGIREFVVGTGGKNFESDFQTIKPHSQARDMTTFGVLRLVLRPDRYRWRFVPARPTTPTSFRDSGSHACH
jgi:acid phosphatase type 7